MAGSEKRKYRDRREYLIEAVRKRRKKIRVMAAAYKGGKCERCGYDRCIEALDFHHTNPSEKDFSISHKGYTRSWKRVQAELDKCMILCANCHREVHAELAASNRNVGVKSGLSQGNPPNKIADNPELALYSCRGPLGQDLHILPKQSLCIERKGKCRDFTPAILTTTQKTRGLVLSEVEG